MIYYRNAFWLETVCFLENQYLSHSQTIKSRRKNHPKNQKWLHRKEFRQIFQDRIKIQESHRQIDLSGRVASLFILGTSGSSVLFQVWRSVLFCTAWFSMGNDSTYVFTYLKYVLRYLHRINSHNTILTFFWHFIFTAWFYPITVLQSLIQMTFKRIPGLHLWNRIQFQHHYTAQHL